MRPPSSESDQLLPSALGRTYSTGHTCIPKSKSKKELIIGLSKTTSPILLLNLSNVARDFGAGYIMSRVDDQGKTLAASAYISTVQLFLMTIGMSMLFAMSSLVGRNYGEIIATQYNPQLTKEDKERHIQEKKLLMGMTLQQASLLGLGISLPIMGIMWKISPILQLFKQPDEYAQITSDFFFPFLFGVPATMTITALRLFLLSINDRKPVVAINLSGLGLALTLGYGFTTGSLGLPKMGAAGMGLALTIRAWSSLVCYLVYLALKNAIKPYQIFQCRVRENLAPLKNIVTTSLPIAIQIGGEISSLLVNTMLSGHFGTVALSAQNITSHYLSLAIAPVISFSESATILVAQERGQRNYTDMKKIGHASIIGSAMTSSLIFVILSTCALPLAKIFLSPQDPNRSAILDLTRTLLIITGGTQILDAIRQTAAGASRGILDTTIPMLYGLACIWVVGLPSSLLLAFPANLEVTGLALGHGIALLFAAITMSKRWHNKSSEAVTTGIVTEGVKLSKLCSSCFGRSMATQSQTAANTHSLNP